MYSILYIFWCILPYIVNSEDRSDGNDKPRAGRDFQQHVHWYWIWWVAKCPWNIQGASAELEGGVYRMVAFTRQDRAGTLWSCRADDQAGNWEFVIDSLWVDPQTGYSPDPIEAQVVIRQTYTQLHLHPEMLESSGDFLASKIIMKDDGTYRIFGAFENRPCVAIQDMSRTHLGALVLDVIGDPSLPCKLRGSYWTDRGTRGEMHGDRRWAENKSFGNGRNDSPFYQ